MTPSLSRFAPQKAPHVLHALNRQQRRVLLICCLISALGFFDFMVFWHTKDAIAAVFLPPTATKSARDLYALTLFVVGYVARSFGAALTGHYGDKMVACRRY